MQNNNSDPGMSKTSKELYVTLTEIVNVVTTCITNTLMVLEGKNKESVATKKSQVQLKRIKSASVISKN